MSGGRNNSEGGIALKRTWKKALSIMAAVMLALAVFTGCTSKEETAYRRQVTEAVDGISAEVDKFQAAAAELDETQASMDAVVAAAKACREACDAVAEIEAPEELAEVHTLFTEAAEEIGGAMDYYAMSFRDIASIQATSETGLLGIAQERMMLGGQKMQEAGAALDGK